MAVTWADVVNVDAALAAVPVGAQNDILADAAAMLPESRWGTDVDRAVKYLAAHCGVMYQRGGAGGAGPVTSASLGPAAQSFGWLPHVVMDDLEATPWGLRLQLLIRRLAVFAVVG